MFGRFSNKFIWGTRSADTLVGDEQNNKIFGFRGDDILSGNAGNDRLFGGHGNDVMSGGAGNDRLFGGHGDDVAIYNASQNIGSRDVYNGGRGNDTLTLDLTIAEYKNPILQAEIAEYLAFLAQPVGHWSSNGHHYGHHHNQAKPFTFESLGLTVSKFENLKVIIEGQEFTPIDLGVTVTDDIAALGEDDGAITFASVTGNDDVPNGIKEVRLLDGPAQGTLVFNAGTASAPDGSFSFDPAGAFENLVIGESATVSFSYEIEDLDGDVAQGEAEITITGANDAPVLTASTPALSMIGQDVADTNNTGTLVSELISTNITDVDNGALEGIAISEFDAANGIWQYQLAGSTDWVDAPSTTVANSLLLSAADSVRFMPEVGFLEMLHLASKHGTRQLE